MARKPVTTEAPATAQSAPDGASATVADQVTITLPIGGGEQPGYQSQLIEGGDVSLDPYDAHVNVNLGRKAAVALVRVRNGLRAAGAQRGDGRPVWTNADALRFIFEAIADAAG